VKKTLLKVAISLLLITLLLRGADVPGLIARFRGINSGYLFLAVLLMFLLALTHATRWWIIIRANGGRMAFATSLKLVFVGYFFSQALPSSIGGDAIRIWQAHRSGLSLGAALSTVVLDRLVALAALLIMTAAALPWLADLVIAPALRWAVVFVLAGGAGGFAALLALHRLPEFVFKWKVAQAAMQLSEAARKTLLNVSSGCFTLLLSVGVHIGVALVVFTLACALDVKVSLLHCIILIPLVMLVTLLPISIAGWGVREGAMVVALGLIQVSRSDSLAVSLLFGTTLLVTSLPGGVLWWRTGHPTPALPANPKK
jgi:glycosyltransferase 2 family protein